jgi:glycerophosphoryl diester phosphodiesterase
MNNSNSNQKQMGGFVPDDDLMPYPRICAHRGLCMLLPENTLISFGAAIALGVHEIEFDVWSSLDGRLVACHDPDLARIAVNQTGIVQKLNFEEIMQADVGFKKSPLLEGLRIASLEQILELYARRTVINMHIKSPDPGKPYDRKIFQKIVDTIDRYDCRRHVFISGASDVLEAALEVAPDIKRNCLERKETPDIVNNAIKYKCSKLQFFKPAYSREMIDRAHANGIICNMFWSDDIEEARQFYAMGIDTVLTNNCSMMLKMGDVLTAVKRDGRD